MADTRIRHAQLAGNIITLAHGGGGKAMHDLIDDVFIRAFSNPALNLRDAPEDQARFNLVDLARHGDRLALTTDSYVVHPIFFPGGDIGKLAVCGTVNDLAVGGATPLYLTCAMIIEEGMDVATLRQIVQSMADTAKAAGVWIVTGDTKVVERGSCDKIFVNTTGVGVINQQFRLGANQAQATDRILVNGFLGDHGAAILNARGDMHLSSPVESDCACLHELIRALLNAAPDTRFMRDATRGGLASVLNEIAAASRCTIEIVESRLPIRTEVRGFCEILGLDALYLANEGKLVAVVPENQAGAALAAMHAHPLGTAAADIGQVLQGGYEGHAEHAGHEGHAGRGGRVQMQTVFGGKRIVDMLTGEQLPRIC